VKRHFTAALRFYESRLTDDPQAVKKAAPATLWALARVAVLASAGAGHDAPPEVERPKYRAKALVWLREYVKIQQRGHEKSTGTDRYAYEKRLRELAQHRDLAAVRLMALDTLPAAERRDWERFWAEVDALLQKADTQGSEQ
jgi:hypothetical protein